MSRIPWVFLGLPALALSSCAGTPAEVPIVRPFDVVSLIDSAGDAMGTPIDAVRVAEDGRMQALVESGHCVAPVRLDADETTAEVTLSAYVVSTSDGPCTQQIVPVFVNVHLAKPLGDRAVRDGKTGQRVRVVDCGSDPQHPLCTS